MRILFYLPVVTEWWFDNVIVHLIRVAAREAEVHVAVPPLWRLTGISERQLESCLDLPEIRWHILGGQDHQSLRTCPSDPDGLVEFVRGINPDYTFCRSADVATPGRFPGKVRFVMEASFPPFTISNRIMLQPSGLYDHGIVPPLDEDQRAYLDGRIAPGWERLSALYPRDDAARAAYLAEAGLPADRKIIALPLDYEGEENFFYELHGVTPPNAELVADLVPRIGDDCILALTKHPIERELPFSHVVRVAEQAPDRVRIVETLGKSGNATLSLMQHCDGMIVRDSKSFGNSVFLGKPMLRLSRFASGAWMNAYSELPAFLDALRSGAPRVAAAADTRSWIGFHHANNAFVPDDPLLTLDDLIDRVERPVNPARWKASLDLCREYQPMNFA
jgi:hypothetical protein